MDSKKSSAAEVTTIDVHEAQNLLTKGHTYLDVRTEEEFKNGHLENSLNIPYMLSTPEGRVKNPKFVDQVVSLFGKEDHLVVGCQSGVRSLYAVNDLLDAEFKHVYNMGGGYIAWVGKGFLVEKPFDEVEKISIEKIEINKKPCTDGVDKAGCAVEQPCTDGVDKAGCAVEQPCTDGVDKAGCAVEQPCTDGVDKVVCAVEQPCTDGVDKAGCAVEQSPTLESQKAHQVKIEL